jgi:poly-beta-1,6-N-acetyl-D-glucosamine synthase
MPNLTYVLVTPAKNEARFIEKTISSILAQTHKPIMWVIVDDHSSDETSEIVTRYSNDFDFIRLIRRRSHTNIRNFASKVEAFNASRSLLMDISYDLIGNLDADITLSSDYYANIISAFAEDSQLGIAGGTIYLPFGSKYMTDDITNDSVGGAIQLFRRECFEEIGGYMPLEGGGIDAAAEITARMHGWSVRKVTNNPVFEQRPTGNSHGSSWRASYREGIQYHRIGYSTLFYCLRSAYRLSLPRPSLKSMFGLLGFFRSKFGHDKILLPQEVVSYLRAEQHRKIKRALWPWRKELPA